MHLEPSTGAGLLLGICAVLVVVFLFVAHLSNLKQKVPLFYCWLGAIAVLGGAAAFFLPIAVNSGFAKDDDGSALRQALLYTTGGVLGVITLGETHRKNNQEKEKNENDHTRQVYAERRSRYTKAVEQLANDKASVRLGGIYTLVGLVDEWLADGTLNPEKRQKEGQVIINNLCAYIRSPFPLAVLRKGNTINPEFAAVDLKNPDGNSTRFLQEQDTRTTIFTEINNRISSLSTTAKAKSEIWKKFKYDFSGSDIFYSLENLSLPPLNFSGAKFYGLANFMSSKFTGHADFSSAYFIEETNFQGTDFSQGADFRQTSFAYVEPSFGGSKSQPQRARFSAQADPQDYLFEARPESAHGFRCGEAELLNRTFILPLGAVLYDPDSWDEEKQEYTRISEPAQ